MTRYQVWKARERLRFRLIAENKRASILVTPTAIYRAITAQSEYDGFMGFAERTHGLTDPFTG